MSYGLTPAQRDCLLVIQELTDQGQSPSLEEIKAELCLSNRGAAHRILLGLRERGWIEWEPKRPRTIVLYRRIPFPEEPEIVGTFDWPELIAARQAGIPYVAGEGGS